MPCTDLPLVNLINLHVKVGVKHQLVEQMHECHTIIAYLQLPLAKGKYSTSQSQLFHQSKYQKHGHFRRAFSGLIATGSGWLQPVQLGAQPGPLQQVLGPYTRGTDGPPCAELLTGRGPSWAVGPQNRHHLSPLYDGPGRNYTCRFQHLFFISFLCSNFGLSENRGQFRGQQQSRRGH